MTSGRSSPTASISERLHRLTKGFVNYEHPLLLQAQRMLRLKTVLVQDRRTALRFKCLRGADRMFGETFHARHYDIPTAPVEPGHTVIDVGANHGFASCLFGRRGANVFAFEPNPTVFSLLQENIERNELSDRVQAHPHAIRGCGGPTTLFVSDHYGGGMSSVHEGYVVAHGVSAGSAVEASSTTLQEVIDEMGIERIRLLKLDCEGSELEILNSIGTSAAERIDSLAVEIHSHVYSSADLLGALSEWTGFHLSRPLSSGARDSVIHMVNHRVIEDWMSSLTSA